MGQVYVLEMELDRYLSSPNNQMMQIGGNLPFESSAIEVRWKGTLKIYSYQLGKLVLQKDLGTIDILDQDYDQALLPFFQEAYDFVRVLPMFEEAVLETVGYCHHDMTCDFMTLTIDKEAIKFYVSSNEEGYQDKLCPVSFSESTLKKVENQTKIKFSDFKNIDPQFQVDFFRLWSPQTVRRYTIGAQSVQVFSLGRGDKSRYLKTKEDKWKHPVLENIGYYIQGNDVVFHGQRFDLLHFL